MKLHVGRVEKRGSGGADPKKQHNGIHPFGIHSYHAQFSDCPIND